MRLFDGRPANRIVILTGAGVSAESGLKTFRDADGLWEGRDPMEIATPAAFERDPALVHRFYNERRRQLVAVQPNAAHRALAKLQAGYAGDVFLVTQNVDDLHERGGSGQVCHMHGELRRVSCSRCGAAGICTEDCDVQSRCRRCGEAGGLRPAVVWFGEVPHHMDLIASKLAGCDLFIAIGTSGVVYPAAGFVREARMAGAFTVEVNPQATEIAGHFHQRRQGRATVEVPALVRELLGGAPER